MVEHVKSEIIKFRSNQWQQFANKLGSRPLSSKPFWNRINRLRNKKQPNQIPAILDRDSLLVDDDDKVEAFGRKLESTFNENLVPRSEIIIIDKICYHSIVNVNKDCIK